MWSRAESCRVFTDFLAPDRLDRNVQRFLGKGGIALTLEATRMRSARALSYLASSLSVSLLAFGIAGCGDDDTDHDSKGCSVAEQTGCGAGLVRLPREVRAPLPPPLGS